MTLCVLGMSQEFKNDGIAVNGLWPKKRESVELNGNKFFLPVNQHLQSHHLQLLMYYTYLPKQLM